MSTFGPAFDGKADGERLRKQHLRIKEFMLDGAWRTLGEIATRFRYPESSVSAQLRHLRKPEFGSFTVNKRRREGYPGLWEYQVLDPQISFDEQGQATFFAARPNNPVMWGH